MASVHPAVGDRPNLALNSDPACTVPRSLSFTRFLGSALRLAAGRVRLASFVRPRIAGLSEPPFSPANRLFGRFALSFLTGVRSWWQRPSLLFTFIRSVFPSPWFMSGQNSRLGLTVSSTRTPPALSSAPSQLPASSAPLSASAQARPVSFVR